MELQKAGGDMYSPSDELTDYECGAAVISSAVHASRSIEASIEAPQQKAEAAVFEACRLERLFNEYFEAAQKFLVKSRLVDRSRIAPLLEMLDPVLSVHTKVTKRVRQRVEEEEFPLHDCLPVLDKLTVEYKQLHKRLQDALDDMAGGFSDGRPTTSRELRLNIEGVDGDRVERVGGPWIMRESSDSLDQA